MKTISCLLLVVSAFVGTSCRPSGEGTYKNFRSGSPESVGFDSGRLAKVDSVMEAAMSDSVFPAAHMCVVKDDVVVLNKAFGRFTYDADAPRTSLQSLFDLASLTKVIVTTSAIMRLYDEGKISLGDKVGKFILQFEEGKKSEVTIRHLLSHTSGLPPFRQLWKICPHPLYAIDTVFATNLVANPGDSTIYSDLGFIILGKIVEQVSGMRLDEYAHKNFFEPLGMKQTMFRPPKESRSETVPTEYDSIWRKKLVQGTVHDENAEFLGGVSGHAGLFSTAHDLAIFMKMIMDGGMYNGKRYLEPSTIALFTQKQSEQSSRALGWDTKSPKGSMAGNLFSEKSFGHSGFTGTTIWVDPQRNLFLILLTNRVYPTRANGKISRVRPVVHDAVVRALLPS